MNEHVTSFGTTERPARVSIAPAGIEQPVLGDFLRYWQKLRGDAALPAYGGFNPRDVKAHLGWVVIADALPDYADFRFRLVGTHVARYFLSDGTGKTIRETFGPGELGEAIVGMYRLACIEGAPVHLSGPAKVVDNILFPDYDTMYLPFSTTGARADRVVNVFTFDLNGCVTARQVDPAELPPSMRAPTASYSTTV
jgi:hypothetical protein